jgi:glyoxylase-like metal-dependent hydrolase (beta-lactamase superfamily II)
MKLGGIDLYAVSDGHFWLDGGSMFGVVPKVLWNKLTPADPKNRIRLALNCLLIKANEKSVLVDTGIGDKFDSKLEEMYRLERTEGIISSMANLGVQPQNIDVVINTHLHFDHCGGNTVEENGEYVPTFPRAKYVIQEKDWQAALNTDEKTRSSYRRSDFMPLEEAGQLTLVDGEYEVTPGVRVIATTGHTRGHQSVLITSNGHDALYLGDLIPTTYHLKIPYLTGYDQYPVDLIKCKKDIIKKAAEDNWLLIFEHDPNIMFAHVTEENGKQVLNPLEPNET